VDKYEVDVMILLERGDVDIKLCHRAFNAPSLFFQNDENKNRRVLIPVRTHLYASRVKYDLHKYMY
jgi:hypothetical protein